MMKLNFTTLVCTRNKENSTVSEYCAVKVSVNDFGAFEVKRTYIDSYDYATATFWAGLPVLKHKRISWLYESLDFLEDMMSTSDIVVVGNQVRDFVGLSGIIRKFIPHGSDLYRHYRRNAWDIREIKDLVPGKGTTKEKVESSGMDFNLIKDIACAICDYDSWDYLSDSTMKCATYICLYMDKLGYDLDEFYQAIEEVVEAENGGIDTYVPLRPITEREQYNYG